MNYFHLCTLVSLDFLRIYEVIYLCTLISLGFLKGLVVL